MAKLIETPKPGQDVYTGLLGLSLAAMVAGCVLLGLDLNSYGDRQPPVLATPTVPKVVSTQAAPAEPRVKPEEKKEEPAPAPEKPKETTFRMPEPTLPTPLVMPVVKPTSRVKEKEPSVIRMDPLVVPSSGLDVPPAKVPAPAPKQATPEDPPAGITPFQIPK